MIDLRNKSIDADASSVTAVAILREIPQVA
jgi:hypothetical protein